MQHKILYRYLPIFLSVLVVCCMPMRAAAAVGVGSLWDGDVSVVFPDPYLYVDYAYKIHEYTTSNVTKPYVTETVHHANQNVRVCIDSDYSGYFINGTLGCRVTVNASPSSSTYTLNILTPYCEPVVLDDVYATIELLGRSTGACTFDILLEFNNYYVDQSEFSIPLNIQYDLNGYFYTADTTSLESFYCTFDILEDYHGTIMKYDNLEEVPSTDGYIASQNQTIIDQSQTQNNLTTEQNTLIQDQTQQQHSDSQAEIQSGKENTNTIINGYDNTAGEETAGRLEDTTSGLDAAEESLFGSGFSDHEDYVDVTNFFSNTEVVESFSFVKSAMESMYLALGDFGIPITVGCLFLIVTRILGFQQFSSGGG